MIPRPSRSSLLLVASLTTAFAFGACKSSPQVGGGSSGDGDSGDGDTAGEGTDTLTDLDDVLGEGGAKNDTAGFTIEAGGDKTLVVVPGQPLPTLTFTATNEGSSINPGWSVDRGEIATISEDGVLTPTGLVGGVVTVSAGLNGEIVTTEVVVQIQASQNGPDTDQPGQAAQIPDDVDALTEGGGPGGVGGDGLGTAVGSDDLLAALKSPTADGAEQKLKFIYPYDGTVFPRGLPAPLIAWQWDPGNAQAISLSLKTKSGSFEWTGSFGPPAILGDTGGDFVQHPIPQEIWDAATNSSTGIGDEIELSLTVASGGEAYGPITQEWTVAQARLSGTIYYNSYGTNLAKNHGGAEGGDGAFGGATLGIRVGDSAPTLVGWGNLSE